METDAIRKLGCGFVFAFHSNYGAILYRLRAIGLASHWLEIEKLLYSILSAPVRGDRVRISRRCFIAIKLE